MTIYTHRNGEIEPPTIEGWYWCKDSDGDFSIVLVWIFEEYTAIHRVGSENKWYSDNTEDMEDFDGTQWYGPITPPWEES